MKAKSNKQEVKYFHRPRDSSGVIQMFKPEYIKQEYNIWLKLTKQFVKDLGARCQRGYPPFP